MKKSRKLFLVLCTVLFIALLPACSSDNEEQVNPQKPQDENSTVVDLGNVKFDISEMPFGEDIEKKTRTAEQPLMTDTVVLSKSVEAEVTLEQEELPVTRGVKNGLSDGTYRMMVYQANTFKGKISFTVSGGNITYLEKLILQQGTYDFYCCNDKVEFNQVENKFKVEVDNAGTALIGITKNVQVSGIKKTVNFPIKHVGTRIKTRLTALMPFPGDVQAKLISTPNGAIGDVIYDIPTGTYSSSKQSTLSFPTTAYTAATDIYDPTLLANIYAMESSDYRYMLQNNTLTNLMLQFTNSGQLYRKAMSSYGALKINSGTQQMLAGHSYVLRVKLKPAFRYLFQDGTTGYLRDKGNRIPVALVLNKRLGVALYDSHVNSDFVPSYFSGGVLQGNWSVTGQQDNDRIFSLTQWNDAITTVTSGAHWTWAAGGTLNHTNPAYNGSKGAKRETYPAFYWADAYRKDMLTRCQNEGKAYDTDLLAQTGRWFLPSVNEWMVLLDNLGFGNHNGLLVPGGVASGIPISTWYNILIVKHAFISAGGWALWDDTDPQGRYYWTSTEGPIPTQAYIITTRPDFYFFLSPANKNLIGLPYNYTKAFRVRAFVVFENTTVHPNPGSSSEDGWAGDPDIDVNGDDMEVDL